MMRLAVLVGCNYPGTEHELRGCFNDVVAMRDKLMSRCGFAPQDITLLTDRLGAAPTGANIRRELAQMVQRAREGAEYGKRAILFFHFSGHGTLLGGGQYPRHEAIVPSDFNLITDVDFRRLVDQVPHGATFTMVSDSCHSGELIALEKEQIGPASHQGARAGGLTRRRFLPYATVLNSLGVAGSHHAADPQQHARYMVARFGSDASALFHRARAPVPRPDSGILLSGCQWNESSEDGEYNGAFTLALVNALSDSAKEKVSLSNRDLVHWTRYELRRREYTQHPCLYCSDANFDRLFLDQGRL